MTTQSAPQRRGPADDGLAAWRASVATVLAKSRRQDVSDLPSEPERLLETTTYDDLTIAALYTRDGAAPEPAPPGVAPYTRGHLTPGWHVCTRHGRGGAQDDPAEVNRHILHDLENGATSLWLGVGGPDLPVSGLRDALAGVFLDLAPVVLDAGTDLTAAADALLALVEESDGDEAQMHLGFGADPVGTLVRTGRDPTAEAVDLARRVADRSGRYRTFVADGTLFGEAGASDTQELGAAVAEGVAYVRAMTGAGMDLGSAFGQVEFRFSAGDDQFLTMAKFRAARMMWARVTQAAGTPDAGPAPQHAVTAAAMMAKRDPWVNLLRTTLAAFGAGLGGADAVTVLPFDVAVPGGVPGVDDELAARLARNTQLLLLEESHLGRVLDPAGGSFYVERLTAQLAAAAWAWFQEIEAAGGFPAALDLVADRIAMTRARRDDDVAHRRTPITAVSEFPDLGERPLPPRPRADSAAGDHTARLAPIRYAAAFEALRDRSDAHLAATGERPSVLLATLGPVAEHNVRATFTTNLLASGGIAALPAGPHDPADAGTVRTETATPVAVLCGTDKRYASDAEAAITALRTAGATTILVAGAQKSFPATDPGPDGFVGLGVDAPAVLGSLLDTLGVTP